jgi:hypothetical protein
MKTQMPRSSVLLLKFLCGAWVLGCVVFWFNHAPPPNGRAGELRAIVYRYAQMLTTGSYGYTVGQQPSLTPPPLDSAIIALGLGSGQPAASVDRFLGALGLFMTCGLLYRFLTSVSGDAVPIGALAASSLFAALTPAVVGLDSASYIGLGLGLAAIICARYERLRWMAVLLGVAILVQFEMLLLLAVLLMVVDFRKRSVMAVCAGIAIIPIGIVLLMWRPLLLNVTASVSVPLSSPLKLVNSAPELVFLVPFAILGCGIVLAAQASIMRGAVAWGVLGLVGTWALYGESRFGTLMVAICILLGLGLADVAGRWRAGWVAAPIALLLTVGSLSRVPPVTVADPAIERRLEAAIPEGKTVGLAKLDIHTLAIQRPIVDLSGDLNPQISAGYLRGDYESAVISTLPDYLLPENGPLSEAPWFRQIYALVPAVEPLYRRTITPGPLGIVHTVDHAFAGSSLRLVGFAIDRATLTADDPTQETTPLRLRLDWENDDMIAPYQLEAALLRPPADVYAQTILNIVPTRWYAGQFSTWHLLTPGARLPVGPLSLAIAVTAAEGKTVTVIGMIDVVPKRE